MQAKFWSSGWIETQRRWLGSTAAYQFSSCKPVCYILQKRKEKGGFRWALPFCNRLLVNLWGNAKNCSRGSTFSVYNIEATFVCFDLRLWIEKSVRLTWSDVQINTVNNKEVPYDLIKIKDRNYTLSYKGYRYAILKEKDKECRFLFVHLDWFIKMYRHLLGRDFLLATLVFFEQTKGWVELFLEPVGCLKIIHKDYSHC